MTLAPAASAGVRRSQEEKREIIHLVEHSELPMRRTLDELLADRMQAYAELAQNYQASHPSVKVKNGMCFQVECS
ncbi:MAG TPA: hypothetical protein VII93_06735 [Anaerolineales bacterium]